MKFFILLVILCTATATQLKTKKPEEIGCWILEAGSEYDNYAGGYKITFAQDANTAGLVFKGLTQYSKEGDNEKTLAKAFTSEAIFNSFFVKNGDNYMIPFRFFTQGSTTNLCNTCFKYMDYTVQNDSNKTVSFRIQNQYYKSGTVWDQSNRQTFIDNVLSIGKTKRVASSALVSKGQNSSTAFFEARFAVAGANVKEENYKNILKDKKEATTARIKKQTAEQAAAQKKYNAAKQAEVEAKLALDAITRTLNVEKTNLQSYKIDDNYAKVKESKDANVKKMAEQKALFDTNTASIAKLSGPQIANISKNLSDAINSANAPVSKDNNPQQKTIEENLSKIS